MPVEIGPMTRSAWLVAR